MYSTFIIVFACTIHKMVILFDIAPCCCLRELFGDFWTKTLQYLVYQIEVPFVCSIGIFSDRKSLELRVVSISFEYLLLRLIFTRFCFACVTIPLVFVCDYRKCCRLPEPYFFLLGQLHTLFPWVDCHTYPSIFQWSCPTEFCVTATQCFFWNYKPSCFLLFYTLYLCCVDWHTFLYRFLSGTVPLFFVWMSHKYPVSLHYLCVNGTHVRLHFLWMNDEQIHLCLHYF